MFFSMNPHNAEEIEHAYIMDQIHGMDDHSQCRLAMAAVFKKQHNERWGPPDQCKHCAWLTAHYTLTDLETAYHNAREPKRLTPPQQEEVKKVVNAIMRLSDSPRKKGGW